MEINNVKELRASIRQLEEQTEEQKEKLVKQFHDTYNSMKPINILKNSLNKVVHSPDVVEKIVNTGMGVGLSLLTNRLVIGKSAGVARKLFGTAMELGLANIVARKAAPVKLGALNILSKIFRKKSKTVS
ncbi:hypothetical protein QWZ08_24685 [Ferruginibacter paludis]|uniref:hypothetical protein n=1 Tax=Ferruginibacter paludis TaxID=1310417 RepID=UPI0025B34A89|nr:hypothetical protein [Ferruginibacter paludis]MDN3658863.1 hypothetical protein [Ferruginibacter paludis]